MPLQCEQCGHIHWRESKSLARKAEWVVLNSNASPITSRDLADGLEISIQNANNALRKLEALGAVKDCGRDAQPTGGVEREWRHDLSLEEIRRLQLAIDDTPSTAAEA